MRTLFAALEFDRKDLTSYVLLVSAPVLLSLSWYYGSAAAFGKFFPAGTADPASDFYSRIYQFVSFFVLLFVVPLLYLRSGTSGKWSEFGFGLGDKEFGARACLLIIPFLVVPLTLLAATLPGVRSEYPLSRLLLTRHDLVLPYEVAYVVFYYLAWEFYFRGFLLFGLKGRLGNMNAVLVQTISSSLFHLGKPDAEMFGSILAGVAFGALALRTGSFWYGFLVHAVLGVLTDLFVIFS